MFCRSAFLKWLWYFTTCYILLRRTQVSNFSDFFLSFFCEAGGERAKKLSIVLHGCTIHSFFFGWPSKSIWATLSKSFTTFFLSEILFGTLFQICKYQFNFPPTLLNLNINLLYHLNLTVLCKISHFN